MDVDEIVEKAKIAKSRGASRFCMGAAWRGPKPKDVETVSAIIKAVKGLGMETCGTFGMLEDGMAEDFKKAGLDYYNHNLDHRPRTLQRHHSQRENTRPHGYFGQSPQCRFESLLRRHRRHERNPCRTRRPDCQPCQPRPSARNAYRSNQLVKVEGTPLADAEDLDWTEFVRTIAVARITMPHSYVRLSAGRSNMPESMQAMCFMAGANSIFYGDKLLTTETPTKTATAC